MKHGAQKIISQRTGFSKGYVSRVINGKTTLDSWSAAKKFAAATNTTPYLWLEGTPEEIQAAISDYNTWKTV